MFVAVWAAVYITEKDTQVMYWTAVHQKNCFICIWTIDRKEFFCEPAQIYEDILVDPQCDQNFNNELNAFNLAFNIS